MKPQFYTQYMYHKLLIDKKWNPRSILFSQIIYIHVFQMIPFCSEKKTKAKSQVAQKNAISEFLNWTLLRYFIYYRKGKWWRCIELISETHYGEKKICIFYFYHAAITERVNCIVKVERNFCSSSDTRHSIEAYFNYYFSGFTELFV